MGKKMPVTFVCFTVLSLSLIGIPPMGGFFSKWELATASLDTTVIGAFGWIIPVILLVSALLTAGYLLDISIRAFFRNEEDETPKVKESKAMCAVLIVLSVASLLGGVFASHTGNMISAIVSALF